MPITIEKLIEELQEALNSSSSQIHIAGDDATLIVLQENANQDGINRARAAFLKHPDQSELVVVREDGTIVCSYRYQEGLQGKLSLQKENTVHLFDQVHASLKLEAALITSAEQITLFEQVLAQSNDKTAVVKKAVVNNILSLAKQENWQDVVLANPEFVKQIFSQSQRLDRMYFVAWCGGALGENPVLLISNLIKNDRLSSLRNQEKDEKKKKILEEKLAPFIEWRKNHSRLVQLENIISPKIDTSGTLGELPTNSAYISQLQQTLIDTVLYDQRYWGLPLKDLLLISQQLVPLYGDAEDLFSAKNIAYRYAVYHTKLAVWKTDADKFISSAMSSRSLHTACGEFLASFLQFSSDLVDPALSVSSQKNTKPGVFLASAQIGLKRVFEDYCKTIFSKRPSSEDTERENRILSDVLTHPLIAKIVLTHGLGESWLTAQRLQINFIRVIDELQDRYSRTEWQAIHDIFAMDEKKVRAEEENVFGMVELRQLGKWMVEAISSGKASENPDFPMLKILSSMYQDYVVTSLKKPENLPNIRCKFLAQLGELPTLSAHIREELTNSIQQILQEYHASLFGYHQDKPPSDSTNQRIIVDDLLAHPAIAKAFMAYAEEPLIDAIASVCVQRVLEQKHLTYSSSQLQALREIVSDSARRDALSQLAGLSVEHQLAQTTTQHDAIQQRAQIGQFLKKLLDVDTEYMTEFNRIPTVPGVQANKKPSLGQSRTAETDEKDVFSHYAKQLFFGGLQEYVTLVGGVKAVPAALSQDLKLALLIQHGLAQFPAEGAIGLIDSISALASSFHAACSAAFTDGAIKAHLVTALSQYKKFNGRDFVAQVEAMFTETDKEAKHEAVQVRISRANNDQLVIDALKIISFKDVVLYVDSVKHWFGNQVRIRTEQEWQAAQEVLKKKYGTSSIRIVTAKPVTVPSAFAAQAMRQASTSAMPTSSGKIGVSELRASSLSDVSKMHTALAQQTTRVSSLISSSSVSHLHTGENRSGSLESRLPKFSAMHSFHI